MARKLIFVDPGNVGKLHCDACGYDLPEAKSWEEFKSGAALVSVGRECAPIQRRTRGAEVNHRHTIDLILFYGVLGLCIAIVAGMLHARRDQFCASTTVRACAPADAAKARPQ